MVLKFERFFSPAGENRGIHLYLPDDYYESQERYPVLYMFDGHNLFFDGDLLIYDGELLYVHASDSILQQLAQNRQVIRLTCQRREKDA